MSIVEKALKKLQTTGQAPPGDVHAPLEATRPVGRVLTVERPELRVPHGPQARRPVGNVSKIVHIDHERLRQQGLMPPEHQQRELAHQYRTLKRPLVRHAFEPVAGEAGPGTASRRSIMVSSALPGEGKTFTSINLAMSLSLEKDHSVLLVDGDIPKPHVSQTFGVAGEPGLLDVLTDESLPIESVVLPTDVRGLSILPVGRRTETATELLASARMQQVIAELEQLDPQGLVVVDSPPILLTSEARVLASLFGQVVLVVQAGATPRQAVMDAIQIIGEGPRVGLVLNQALHEAKAGGYYYGYGHYYGSEAGAAGAEPGPEVRVTAAGDNP